MLKMQNEMEKTFRDALESAKDILQHKKRAQIPEMLTILHDCCETVNSAGGKILNEEFCAFWVMDIIDLLFDEDVKIQTQTVETFEMALRVIDIERLHAYGEWPKYKSELITNKAPKIEKLRKDLNSHWYRVWCIVVSFLDAELLRTSSVINAFLSIVEMGFRNAENRIREEAYKCWYKLIQLFAKHHEFNEKRLRLLCIPLKSSHPKTKETAIAKFRIWWYLLWCLNVESAELFIANFNVVVKSFLLYCFGGKNSADKFVQSAAKQYDELYQLSTLCMKKLLVAMDINQSDSCTTKEGETTQQSFDDYEKIKEDLISNELEIIDNPLLLKENEKEFEKYWESLAEAAFRAFALRSDKKVLKNAHPLTNDSIALDRNNSRGEEILEILLELSRRKDYGPFTEYIWSKLEIGVHHKLILNGLKRISLHGIILRKTIEKDFNIYYRILNIFIDVLMKTASSLLELNEKSPITKDIWEFCLKNLLLRGQNNVMPWKDLEFIIRKLLKSNEDDEKDKVHRHDSMNLKLNSINDYTCKVILQQMKLNIWKYLMENLHLYLNDNHLDVRVKEKANLLYECLLCPFDWHLDFYNNHYRSTVKENPTSSNDGRKSLLFVSQQYEMNFIEYDRNYLSIDIWQKLLTHSQHSYNCDELFVQIYQRLENFAEQNALKSYFSQYFGIYMKIKWKLVLERSGSDHDGGKKNTNNNLKDTPDESDDKEGKCLMDFINLLKVFVKHYKFDDDEGDSDECIVIVDNKADERIHHSSPLRNVLNVFSDVLKQSTRKSINKLLDNLKQFLIALKTLIVKVCDNKTKQKGNNMRSSSKKVKWYESYERELIDTLKMRINYRELMNIKDQLRKINGNNNNKQNGDDDFVVIPKVWSLNPEKLTDRQKESLTKKANIPALYNDDSASIERDSGVYGNKPLVPKPWTPKSLRYIISSQTEDLMETEKDEKTETTDNNQTVTNSIMNDATTNTEQHNNETDIAHQNNSPEIPDSEEPAPLQQGSPPSSVAASHIKRGRKSKSKSLPDGEKYFTRSRKISDTHNLSTEDSLTMSSRKMKRSRGDAVNEQEQESPIPIEEANQQQEKEEEEVEEKKGLKETNQPEESTLVLSGTEVEIINTKSSPVEHVQIPETEDGSGMEEMPALCDEVDNIPENGQCLFNTEEEIDLMPSKAEEQNNTSARPAESNQNEFVKDIMETDRIPNEVIIDCEEENNGQLSSDSENLILVDNLNNSPPLSSSGGSQELNSSTQSQTKTKNHNEQMKFEEILNRKQSIKSPERQQKRSSFQVMNSFNRESSPERTIPTILGDKIHSTTSPPDRRSIINSTSPSIKSRTLSHMTGRGAQLINMIRNKKAENSPVAINGNGSTNTTPFPTLLLSTPEGSSSQINLDNCVNPNNNSNKYNNSGSNNEEETDKELLVFSKRIPSPTASPSASILKRKFESMSTEQVSEQTMSFNTGVNGQQTSHTNNSIINIGVLSSPALCPGSQSSSLASLMGGMSSSSASKRKRVSFHDPPVSLTKKYLIDSDESKLKSKRCLMDKYELHERANSDSKLTVSRKRPINWLEQLQALKSAERFNSELNCDHEVISPKRRRISADPQQTEKLSFTNGNSVDDEEKKSKSAITLTDAIQLVVEQCAPNTIMEKYLTNKGNKWSPLNTTIAFCNSLSNTMLKQPKILSTVLEMLSEKHAKEFLDHAVQENLSSVVCDRLNYESILDYVTIKSKMDRSCCNALLRQIPEILDHRSTISHSNTNNDGSSGGGFPSSPMNTGVEDNHYQFRFISSLLERTNFTDDEIFQMIGTLTMMRQRKKEQRMGS